MGTRVLVRYFGDAHATHSEAESGLVQEHTEHVQVPSLGAAFFIPDPAQSKATGGGTGVDDEEGALGDGTSQMSQ